ncbi:ethanolamine-phosphate phospho-lyase [Fistulifera solaris]|uniref:Ethanolamine-phosphate phospho-lyase n=1 Tax=Fistulifera solaris TaxID=1519565 RepID=A0A1Z5JF10_FISSO|nr:ethanolamine-phosphate phospho-lyase [Fistulifera solaris]|eukprot:GAX12597.1 ethanolamine-phosphate phospho-lyase [Fistulifera solaris]
MLSSKEVILVLRRRLFSKSLSLSYENSDPLLIVEGRGCYLIDERGHKYLDTRNNVAHVGHSHPHVVQAIQRQVALLNTNTRYLHPTMTRLAERLVRLLPDSLEVVFFCNSGSEANDLALRLARAYAKGSENTIVMDRAYHGHTLGTLQVSPYKYDHGSESIHTNPSHYYKVPCPDTYRGVHRDLVTAGTMYAKYVQEACHHFQSKGEKIRAWIVEGGMSVAGVILPPKGYLSVCAEAVRAAGGLYIADEVQTGFGRLGSCLWAFQHNDPAITPDIVTVGKPFGNGMPLAAIVTTRKVASAFEKCGIEYFKTFGGNPVCAAAGVAVLDVLEKENLQQNALEVGMYLKQQFELLQSTIELIGDVRGSGLFLGVELVRDRSSLEPATAEASFICSILKSKYHILTSIDGQYDNVIVIKPPMVFSKTNAVEFIASFRQAVLLDLPAVDLTKTSFTPT